MKKKELAITVASSGENEQALQRLRRVADSFVINEQAKESIAQKQISQFFELLCAALRQALSQLEAKIQVTREQALVSQNQSSLSPFPGLGLATMLLPTSAQGTGAAAMAAMTMAMAANQMAQTRLQSHARDVRLHRMENVVLQFENREAQIRETARTLTMRFVDQIVALNKDSQAALARVISDRIVRHFMQSPRGYLEESRKPLVARIQRQIWRAEDAWHSLMTAPDRIPVRRVLDLNARSVRAITAESGEREDIALHFEPWFSPKRHASVNGTATTQWTAAGLLAKTGIRVTVNAEKGEEVNFVHEHCDVETYGFAYGTEEEAMERKMWRLTANGEPAEAEGAQGEERRRRQRPRPRRPPPPPPSEEDQGKSKL